MKTYTITSGSFRRDDGSVANTGETIELEDDVAALHASQIQPVTAAPAAEPGHSEQAAQ